MPATALLDVRMSKDFAMFRNSRLGMFFDVYNMFNRNATQELSVALAAPTCGRR